VAAVPEGEYYMLGDNRDNSRDSRYWGTVPTSFIKGKAMLVYWSYEGNEQTYMPSNLKDRLLQFGNVITHFFTKTRWNRSLMLIE
jgi:signal peptidase I